MRYSIKKRNGNYYKGEFRSGTFEIDGCKFSAGQIHTLEIDPDSNANGAGRYDDGFVKLIDGSRFKIKQWSTGWLGSYVHVSLSGEMVLFVKDLDAEISFQAIDISEIRQSSKKDDQDD